jgi:hypothetical protein
VKQAHEQARRKENKTCIVEGTQKQTLNSLRVLTPKLDANKNEEDLKGFK